MNWNRKNSWFSGVAVVLMVGAVAAQNEPRSYKPEEIEIDLTHYGCFGVCPIFSVKISGDGTVKYRGVQHVAVSGERETKISQAAVVNLVNDFLRARVFDAPDNFRSYESVHVENGQFVLGWTTSSPDGPENVLAFRLGARTKTVSLEGFPADELRHISLRIEAIPEIKQWVGRKD